MQTGTGDLQGLLRLVLAGGDVNKAEEQGIYCNSPLHLASELDAGKENSRDIIQVLLENGADANKENRFQQTPLHLACQHGHLYLATVLVEQLRVDLNAPDCGGLTPLMHAVYRGRLEIVDFLTKRGCDLEILDNEASSALDMAVLNQQQDVITLLLKAGCELEKSKGHVYSRSHYVNSYIYSLINQNDVRNVKLLYDSGCSKKEFYLQGSIHESNEIGISVEMREALRSIIFQPRTLKNACRRVLRGSLARVKKKNEFLGSKFSNLSLPRSLTSYLALDEYRHELQDALSQTRDQNI
ncbi:histone-lysine N-methyltransferase EHMT1 isoform X2 [Lingula anatina]|uniref:Histone-lysine N-methyltransferase EHMT1 isoform X2 n=1 Tax=Lingula anatina TaxID=7574 RepID=A0A1S3JFX0_LINAN|nr:histone-lysine N-methyltransferase EHMT1 isoform X2 [Lingula anatina]|eukprot:XP_013408794.1 histone-lysine N-methyltransferase EHMT1 isoform X2 [Lingula anatina]